MTSIETVTLTDAQRHHIVLLQDSLRTEAFFKPNTVTPDVIYRRIRRMMIALREEGAPFACLVEPLIDYRGTSRIVSVTLVTKPLVNVDALLSFVGNCPGETDKTDQALQRIQQHLRCGGVEPAWAAYPEGTAAYIMKYGVWNPYR